ncbi:MAG: mannose-1-phosphate guanylyltransferase [Halobacteriales archaeon]
MDRPIVAVVMAGGTGTRLYPASRSDRPKQFLSLGGGESLLARTVDRLGFADEIVVSTREAFADRIEEHAPDADVLVEPEGKDTGPALAYAAHHAREAYEDPVVLNLPSDHHVEGDFGATARRAVEVAAETGGLVTIGIEPDRPATGYGYIDPGREHERYHEISQFREKPDAETARAFVESGCLWNAGMFAWTPEALLREARESPLAVLLDALEDGDPERGFDAVDPVSIDYAVMEDAREAYVVPATFTWDDLGSWDAVDRVIEGDLAETLTLDAENNLLAGDHHVTAIGVSGLAVVAVGDRVLVVPKEKAERVRDAVSELRAEELF